MGMGFCRGLTYLVDNRVDNLYPQVIQLLFTSEQAVDNLAFKRLPQIQIVIHSLST